ncbi:major capsid protein [Synechococcus phage S-CRM01]|uniref:major head protein n=1 Tax=Synechococcus phage S-CRM01 TaxID=1026955 RepID=UPI000209E356|nr:major head protein [Synechococcus phage S-CRM01]AEC52991.1 major capsid protein [Synechococcus phage S-CRM01]
MSTHQLMEKWAPILDHQDLPKITDPYRRAVTSQLLENQEKFLREQAAMGQSQGLFLAEAPTNSVGADGFQGSAAATGPVAGFDPVLISLIRRSMPNLVAYDVCGVQPMSGPTGLIFSMRSTYNDQNGNEALFDEPDVGFSGSQGAATGATPTESNPGLLATVGSAPGTTPDGSNPGGANYDPLLSNMDGMGKDILEGLGESAGSAFRQMGFMIDKTTVSAKGRALKAQYSMELAQDLRAIQGLDAEAELANILSSEILAEINREIIRTVYRTAVPGAQNNVVTAGTFDLDTDSNGRWAVEKFKGLLFQIERDLNAIGQQTRRNKGNLIICSADVASALTMAGVLDYTPALNANLDVDDTGNCFAGTINKKLKVFIDPYSANISNTHYYVAGYKGTNAYDAGLFYCPYIPLQMVRSVTADTFQPNIGFKTRYGLVANPFAEGRKEQNQGLGRLSDNTNRYYRRVRITNLM